MLEHNDVGSLGVVLNRPSEVPVSEALPGWEDAVMAPSVIFAGGPVEPTGILGIGRDMDGRVSPAELQEGPEVVGLVRLFHGYTGWGPDQLVEELAENAWWVVESAPGDLFNDDPAQLWYEVVGRLGDNRSMLRNLPDHPSMN